MKIITHVKCLECGIIKPIEDMPTTKRYSDDGEGGILKDADYLCTNCDAEGDEYFELIEEEKGE